MLGDKIPTATVTRIANAVLDAEDTKPEDRVQAARILKLVEMGQPLTGDHVRWLEMMDD